MRMAAAGATALAAAAATLAMRLGAAQAQSIGGEQALPPKNQCTVTVSYPRGQPDLVAIGFPGDGCEDEDIALAAALAGILRSTNAQPRCADKDTQAHLPCYAGSYP